MKSKAFFKVLLTVIGGPAAGAFGVWLFQEAPMIHSAICAGGL